MMRYKFLKHTADVKFQAVGKTLEEAFENASLALIKVMTKGARTKAKEEKKFEIRGKDNENLLYGFLEEILFLLDAENFLMRKIKKIEIKKDKLVAEILGDKASNYEFSNDVKAVTYNEMFVKFEENKKCWIVQVVLDV
jgi:SHS2 domain-containing protein